MVCVLSHNVYDLSVQTTLLTVVGTVLGFVISYRTTSSFERYNEGRRLWSQIVLASRTFARTVWFHVPDSAYAKNLPAEELKARAAIEKKTAINLVEAFSVAIKHYLRGEDGIYYQDLYYLVKFLPDYALPAGIPSQTDLTSPTNILGAMPSTDEKQPGSADKSTPALSPSANLPLPATTYHFKGSALSDPYTSPLFRRTSTKVQNTVISKSDEAYLLPASMPPKYHILDLFPFSLLVKMLTKQGKELKGKKAARVRLHLRNQAISHNLPLEISLYLSSYVAALQHRGVLDVPTANILLTSLSQLVESLTGLERILTTPIPFSYSIHLWVVTIIFCLTLPFQTWTPLRWLTIPGTVIISFFFFGFLVAGEEIENPFGYDKNDLNLDHFTHNIIRNELRAITSTPPPDPARWAFSSQNDLIFASKVDDNTERIPPEQWVKRGYARMQEAMAVL